MTNEELILEAKKAREHAYTPWHHVCFSINRRKGLTCDSTLS